MDTVWIVNTRNDEYAENSIFVYKNKDGAMQLFNETIEENKNEREFSFDEEINEATWECRGYFCSVSVWEERLR